MTKDTELPTFPDGEGEGAEVIDMNSYREAPVVPETVEVPPTIAEERQYLLGQEFSDFLYKNRGDIASMGGLIRRLDFEGIIGERISEDEFEFLTDYLMEYTAATVRLALPFILDKLHAVYNPKEDTE